MTASGRIALVLLTLSILLGIARGTRNTFSSLFLPPISRDRGCDREMFSFAVAL